MIMVKQKQPHPGQLSAVVTTLDRVFRPDPIIPDAMMALLRSMDAMPASVAAAALPPRHELRP